MELYVVLHIPGHPTYENYSCSILSVEQQSLQLVVV
jgi:hypothetical protein